MPASDQITAILPGLSPIRGREIEARFDGALMSSDGGLLVLREIEQRFGIARRLATCIRDPRAPERVGHRRHLRRRARQPATAPVQRPL